MAENVERGKAAILEGPQVTVRLAASPMKYHLIEIHHRGQSVCIQIHNADNRREVCALAAEIAGLGTI